jgi:phosphatidate cytidylyltransferase
MSKKMLTKIGTALILVALCVPPLFIGGIPLKILLLVIAFIASYEIASLADHKHPWITTILNCCAIAGISLVPDSHVAVVEAVWLIVLFTIELIDEDITTDAVVYPFALTSLVGMALHSVITMYQDKHLGVTMLVFVLLASIFCDTGAYFVGVSFGRHKMIPRVSPNKTWEGSVGGFVCGFLAALIYGLLGLKNMPLSFVICGSICMPLVAQIGDLSFSSIKRRFGIKDFGNFLPGHGGVLDRIDSIVFCLMFMNAMMIVWRIMA